MLRNGLNTIRVLPRTHFAAPPTSASSSIAGSIVHRTSTADSSYICFPCQIRTASFRSLKGRRRQDAPPPPPDTVGNLDSLRRMENIAAEMEKNAGDLIRQKESEKNTRNISPEEEEQFFQALMEPEKVAKPELMISGPQYRLQLQSPLKFLKKLDIDLQLPEPPSDKDKKGKGKHKAKKQEKSQSTELVAEESKQLKTTDTDKKIDYLQIFEQVKAVGELRGWNLKDAENFLYSLLPETRAAITDDFLALVQATFGSIPEKIYTAAMDGLLRLKMPDTLKARELFETMKRDGIQPGSLSYGLLLKAHSKNMNIKGAAETFKEMERAKVIPGKEHYTTFLQTCINRKEFETAWEVFNVMKLRSGEQTSPDMRTYSLMIRACAERGEVERAMDLFTDMTQRRAMEPNNIVYGALMHACAMRPDYYEHTFQIANDMQVRGYPVDVRFLTILLSACARKGDLPRARQIIQYMMESERHQPNAASFVQLFLAYANYIPPLGRKPNPFERLGWVEASQKAAKESPVKAAPPIGSTDAKVAKEESSPKSRSIKQRTPTLGLPFYDMDVLQHPLHVKEARKILNFLHMNAPHLVNTFVCNAFLTVLTKQGQIQDAQYFYIYEMRQLDDSIETFSLKKPKTEDGSEDTKGWKVSEKVTAKRHYRNFKTYDILLEACASSRKALDIFGRRVYLDRQEYFDGLPESTFAKEHLKDFQTFHWLPPKEIEKHNRSAELAMIKLLARANSLGESLARIEASMKIFQWKWHEIKVVYDKAVQLDDMNTARFIRRICRKEHT